MLSVVISILTIKAFFFLRKNSLPVKSYALHYLKSMMANIWPVYRTVHAVQCRSTGVHRPGPASPPHQMTPSKPAQPPLNTPPHNCQNSKKVKDQNNMHVVCTRSHEKQFSTSLWYMSCTKYATNELEAWNWPVSVYLSWFSVKCPQ